MPGAEEFPIAELDGVGCPTLYSGNPGYDPYPLPVSDLVQLWRVRGYLSTAVPPRPDRQGHVMEGLQGVIELLGHDYHEVRKVLDESAQAASSQYRASLPA